MHGRNGYPVTDSASLFKALQFDRVSPTTLEIWVEIAACGVMAHMLIILRVVVSVELKFCAVPKTRMVIAAHMDANVWRDGL